MRKWGDTLLCQISGFYPNVYYLLSNSPLKIVFWPWRGGKTLLSQTHHWNPSIFLISFRGKKVYSNRTAISEIVKNVIFLLLRLTAIKAKMRKNGPYPVPLKMLSNTHFFIDFQKLNCRKKMRTRAKSFVLWKKMSYELASLLKKPSKTFKGFLAAKPASNQKTCEVKLWENGEIHFYAKFQVSILMFTTFYRLVP